MPLDRFLIAPEEVGLQNNIRPWLLPDTGYEQLNNAYIFRGRIRKRFGSRYMVPTTTPAAGLEQYGSRLGITLYANNTIGTPKVTDGAGLVTGNVRTDTGSATLPLFAGQSFLIGTQLFTVISNTAGVQAMKSVDLATGIVSGASTFNVSNGDYSLQTSPALVAAGVKFFPMLPVMGLPSWQTQTLNLEPTIAFDTRFAYQYLATGWERLNLEATAGDAVWLGNNSQFFWAYTYQGANQTENFLFVTNFNAAETHFMRYLDQSFTWHSFAPIYNYDYGTATITGQVISAQIIVGFHDHLVLLNTVENDATLGNGITFKNRARYCAIGTPLDTIGASAVLGYLPWVDNKNLASFRGGGYVDNLQTQEAIISAKFLKDRLIVGYQRSTWELVYTGNQQIPFVWQQINPEFGSQSPFSGIEMDETVLEVAQNGYTACNGAQVQRIDGKIPNEVFNITYANNGTLRVQGIRDYKVEQVYWAIPSSSIGQTFAVTYPNQVLVYNYVDKTWAYNSDSFTAFGYFTAQPAATWGNTLNQWQFMTQTWADGSLQANFPEIIAGNQEGYVVIVDPNLTRNASALSIVNATAAGSVITLTIPSHNLTDTDINTQQDEYIYIDHIAGATGVAYWTSLNGGIFPILDIPSVDTIRIAAFPIADPNPYLGGGTLARVSNLNILSKQWNPYVKSGQNCFIQKINFLVSRTGGVDMITNIPYGGEVTVDYYPNTSKVSTLQTSVPGQLMSSGVMETRPYPPTYYPFEQYQDRVWRPQYLAVDGNAIQIRIIMSDDQIINPNNAFADFQLHGVILEAMPTSSRIGG